MPEPIDDLRAAAKLLRERAEAATPGPWVNDQWEIYTQEVDADNWIAETCRAVNLARDDANGTWVATMHPGVGLALATLLDAVAGGIEDAQRGMCQDVDEVVLDHAVALARLIRGEAPDAR